MYTPVIVGHSFGGSIAAVLGLLLRKGTHLMSYFTCMLSVLTPYPSPASELPQVRVFGFGTMPCMSEELASKCSSFVTSLVCGDDIVPRLHRANLDGLRDEV